LKDAHHLTFGKFVHLDDLTIRKLERVVVGVIIVRVNFAKSRKRPNATLMPASSAAGKT
jgi:hypothetical protein